MNLRKKTTKPILKILTIRLYNEIKELLSENPEGISFPLNTILDFLCMDKVPRSTREFLKSKGIKTTISGNRSGGLDYDRGRISRDPQTITFEKIEEY